jgi:adenylyltransferase/sulfurtransferase
MGQTGRGGAQEAGRYSRQILFEPIGEAGQDALRNAALVLVGCGALGSALADLLVRAGIGYLKVIDRDFIEVSNLQRQMLLDERDIAENLPKAEAAARKLRRINSAAEIEAVVGDVNAGNVAALAAEADLILDGTDNVETRYLVNDLAVREGIPWVYGGCVAAEGRVLAVVPGQTPCLRCLWEKPPPTGSMETCDTVGVLAAAVNVVASLQATEAMKILLGRLEALRGLITVDVWAARIRVLETAAAREASCPCCGQGRFAFLEQDLGSRTTTLCGRSAVQVLPAQAGALDLKRVADRLRNVARPRCNAYMLRFSAEDYAVTVFADGRVIVSGTDDPATARAVVSKYVGM